jgi:membrane protein DedA with SNARE-associated domain
MIVPFALFSVPRNAGYAALAGIIGAESAGAPVPGETTLLTFSARAKHGSINIISVIAIAASAAIIGDNLGYLIAPRVGRAAFARPGRWHKQRLDILQRGEAFFDRHGAKAVFFGRWIAGLRVWASWLAGMTRMPWRQFMIWNALGAVTSAITVGLAGYLLGTVAERVVGAGGAAAGVGISAVILVAIIGWHRRARRHRQPTATPTPTPEPPLP